MYGGFFPGMPPKEPISVEKSSVKEENAQHVAIGLIESSRRHGLVLAVSLGDF